MVFSMMTLYGSLLVNTKQKSELIPTSKLDVRTSALSECSSDKCAASDKCAGGLSQLLETQIDSSRTKLEWIYVWCYMANYRINLIYLPVRIDRHLSTNLDFKLCDAPWGSFD